MTGVLTHNSYGKSRVRLTHVTRQGERHELKELEISVQLEGDFAASYVSGDNRQIVATDSMKNTIYVLARKQGIRNIESFGQTLAQHFVQTYAQVAAATITLEEVSWQRFQDHPHTFTGGSNEKRTSLVTLTRQSLRMESGLTELSLLKTTDSAFFGFVRDEFTTLCETTDRIFATLLSVHWLYAVPSADWDEIHRTARQALVKTFAHHRSLSVQETLHAMGQAVLDVCPEINEITLTMPNKHHLPVNLEPFGLDNPNVVFVPTDEPHGLITGTLSRSGPT